MTVRHAFGCGNCLLGGPIQLLLYSPGQMTDKARYSKCRLYMLAVPGQMHHMDPDTSGSLGRTVHWLGLPEIHGRRGARCRLA
jgi:hypothetical protein